MDNKRKYIPFNFIIISLMVTAFAVAVGLLYDYFFDLNDDVLMKDILSGAFTGFPEGHNIQMLYPISLILSAFYRIVRSADWYGIYLIICQYLSMTVILFFISDKLLTIVRKDGKRMNPIIPAAIGLIIMSGLMMGHLVILQYTFTVALLCAMAAVLIAMDKDVLSVIVLAVSFWTRSEMTMLMLPFVLLTAGYRFMSVRDNKGELVRLIKLVSAVVVMLILSELLHFAGYHSEEWREFTSFFDSRTQIYDFYQIPDYEEHKEFYDSVGMAREEYELLVNYNFGIDDEIDAELMAKISDYAGKVRNEEGLIAGIKRVLPEYFYRMRALSFPKSYEYPMTDAPWNIVTFLLYILAAVAVLVWYKAERDMGRRVWSVIWRILVIFGGRSLLWMYILVRGRDPIRITHSLYLLEIVTLLTLVYFSKGNQYGNGIVTKSEDNLRGSEFGTPNKICVAIVSLIILISVVYIPSQAFVTRTECLGRNEYNIAYQELEDYFRNHEDSFYLMDVYTSVSYDDSGYTYSQRIFGDADNRGANWTLMGGWASKSPAESDKLSYFGIEESMEKALLYENVYVVADKDTDMNWLFDYYNEKGVSIKIDAEDEVAGEFVIYKVTAE